MADASLVNLQNSLLRPSPQLGQLWLLFNQETNRSEDVYHAIAQQILRRLGLEGRNVPAVLEDFIDRHQDRQLALRRALT